MNKNEKGFSLVEGLLLVLVLTVVGFVGWYVMSNQTQVETKKETVKESTSSTAETKSIPDTIISTNNTSPDGSYIVDQVPEEHGDSLLYLVKDKSGAVVVKDIPTDEDAEAMGLGTKIKPQYAVHFAGWVSNDHFAWLINDADGHEYQYIVDAVTGKADVSTFKQLK
jgi:hypothetical protein